MPIVPFVPFNPEVTIKHFFPYSTHVSISDKESAADSSYEELRAHLESHFNEHLGGMTSNEQDALSKYSDSGHAEINSYLHSRTSDPDIMKVAHTLHGAIHRISLSAPLVHPMHTFTGMTSSQEVDPERSSKIHQMISDLSPGQRVQLHGFTSSSIGLRTAVDFTKDMLNYGSGRNSPPPEEHRHIAAFFHPAGSTAGVYIDPVSENRGEHEHLMKPGVGLTFKGTSKTVIVHPRTNLDVFHPKHSIWGDYGDETDEEHFARRNSPKKEVPTVFHFHHFDVEKA